MPPSNIKIERLVNSVNCFDVSMCSHFFVAFGQPSPFAPR
jgi:hypothetical protein